MTDPALTPLSVGDPVVYTPYPGARAEDGTVVEIRGDLVLVRYRGELVAKATRRVDLTPAFGGSL